MTKISPIADITSTERGNVHT